MTQDEIIARVVAEAKENVRRLNAGPMKHTLARRARLEKKNSRRR